jgi:hypothetical protein
LQVCYIYVNLFWRSTQIFREIFRGFGVRPDLAFAVPVGGTCCCWLAIKKDGHPIDRPTMFICQEEHTCLTCTVHNHYRIDSRKTDTCLCSPALRLRSRSRYHCAAHNPPGMGFLVEMDRSLLIPAVLVLY